jgi:hypothetical protein
LQTIWGLIPQARFLTRQVQILEKKIFNVVAHGAMSDHLCIPAEGGMDQLTALHRYLVSALALKKASNAVRVSVYIRRTLSVAERDASVREKVSRRSCV